MDDVTGNLFSLFCSTWRTVLKLFVRLFRIKVSESFEKKTYQELFTKNKMEKRREKELFYTT